MHSWGDEDFDWKALNGAIDEIYYWGKKVGRIGGDLKEKYGTVRWYTYPTGVYKISELIFPGYVYYQWGADRKPYHNIFDQVSSIYMRPFKPLIHKWKRFFYAFAYNRAVKKFPHIKEEILVCTDYPELLFRSEREFLQNLRSDEEDVL